MLVQIILNNLFNYKLNKYQIPSLECQVTIALTGHTSPCALGGILTASLLIKASSVQLALLTWTGGSIMIQAGSIRLGFRG